jgi:hypothetical protein
MDLPNELSLKIDEFIGDKNIFLPISKKFYSKYGSAVRHKRSLRDVRYELILEYLLKTSNEYVKRCRGMLRLTCDFDIIRNNISCYEHMFIFHKWYDKIYIPRHRLNLKRMNKSKYLVKNQPVIRQFREICYIYSTYPYPKDYHEDIFTSYYASMC